MLKYFLGAGFALALCSGVQAGTVTFESVSPFNADPIATVEGFTWDFGGSLGCPVSTSCNSNGWFIGDPNEGYYPNGTVNGTNILIASGSDGLPQGASVEMRAAEGSVFDLTQLDAASSNVDLSNSLYIVGSLLGGGTVSTTLSLFGAFQTYLLGGFANLTKVVFTSVNSGPYNEAGFALDNLHANISTVPLPAGLPLLIAGVAGLSAFARRRRKV